MKIEVKIKTVHHQISEENIPISLEKQNVQKSSPKKVQNEASQFDDRKYHRTGV